MAKKADLLDEAKKIGLSVTEKNTIAEIEAAINNAATPAETPVEAPAAEEVHFAKSGKR